MPTKIRKAPHSPPLNFRQKIGSFCNKNALALAASGGIIALIAACYQRFQGNNLAMIFGYQEPSSWSLKTLLAYYPSPGFVYNSDGSALCEMSTTEGRTIIDNPNILADQNGRQSIAEWCEQTIRRFNRVLPDLNWQYAEYRCYPNRCDDKGLKIDLNAVSEAIPEWIKASEDPQYIRVDPNNGLLFRNLEKALNSLYTSHILNPFPNSMSADTMIRSLQEFRTTLFQGTNEPSRDLGLREQELFIFSQNKGNPFSFAQILALSEGNPVYHLIQKEGRDPQEIDLTMSILKKIKSCMPNTYRDKLLKLLTKEEADFLQQWVSIPINYKEIPQALELFATDLITRGKLVLNDQEDPVALAAWAHQKIIEIHPFLNGNGRIARAWMNMILALKKLPTVIFSTDEEYTEATKWLHDPQPLERLLRKHLDRK